MGSTPLLRECQHENPAHCGAAIVREHLASDTVPPSATGAREAGSATVTRRPGVLAIGLERDRLTGLGEAQGEGRVELVPEERAQGDDVGVVSVAEAFRRRAGSGLLVLFCAKYAIWRIAGLPDASMLGWSSAEGLPEPTMVG